MPAPNGSQLSAGLAAERPVPELARATSPAVADPAGHFETVFETGGWRRYLETAHGYRYAPLRIKLASGDTGTIASYETGRRWGWFRVLCSIPPYHYGSLQVSGVQSAQALANLALQVCHSPDVHSLTLAIHPLDGCLAACEGGLGGYVLSRTATHLLDLKGLRASAPCQAFSKNQRKKLHKALSRGVTIRRSDDPADLERYYPIYLASAARWGLTQAEPKSQLLALQQCLAPYFALWVAEAQGQVIAGLIVLSYGLAAYSLHGASLSSCWDLYPNNLLYSAAIEAACAEGRQYFDFLPSGRLPGVEAFKESFGAQRMPYAVYHFRNSWYASASRFTRRLQAHAATWGHG